MRPAPRLIFPLDPVAAEVELVDHEVVPDTFEVILAVIGNLLAAVPGTEGHDAERVVRPRGAQAQSLHVAAAEVLLADADVGGYRRAVRVDGIERVHVDVTGHGFTGHTRQNGLVGFQATRDHGRKGVEARHPAVFRAGHIEPVECDAGVAERRPPQIDVAGLALVALDRETRHAAEGVGQVLIGEAADRIR